MKIPVESYQIRCDGCGELFENHCGFSCYTDKPSEIETDASESDWLITSDDHHYCPNCYSWVDDGDEIVETKDGKCYDGDYEPIIKRK